MASSLHRLPTQPNRSDKATTTANDDLEIAFIEHLREDIRDGRVLVMKAMTSILRYWRAMGVRMLEDEHRCSRSTRQNSPNELSAPDKRKSLAHAIPLRKALYRRSSYIVSILRSLWIDVGVTGAQGEGGVGLIDRQAPLRQTKDHEGREAEPAL